MELWCPGSVCGILLQVFLFFKHSKLQFIQLQPINVIFVGFLSLFFWCQFFWRENSEKPLLAVKEPFEGSEEEEERVGWSVSFCLSVNDAFVQERLREGKQPRGNPKRKQRSMAIFQWLHRVPPQCVDTSGCWNEVEGVMMAVGFRGWWRRSVTRVHITHHAEV